MTKSVDILRVLLIGVVVVEHQGVAVVTATVVEVDAASLPLILEKIRQGRMSVLFRPLTFLRFLHVHMQGRETVSGNSILLVLLLLRKLLQEIRTDLRRKMGDVLAVAGNTTCFCVQYM